MFELLWLIPFFPLLGFLILALFGRRMHRPVVASIGAGTVGLSALITLLIFGRFLSLPVEERVFTQTLWQWFEAGGMRADIALRLDSLSLLMMFVITFVGFFIHLYSTEFMRGDEGYSRFFAYMNLFVAAMLLLVLADHFVLLYLGWEGVGLCSYLLIGFWYKDPENGAAARKAFLMTRIGDAAMAIGLFLLFVELGTLRIDDVLGLAAAQWEAGSGSAVAAAVLLLIGAIGKSAQLPLQTWLPDAMAGPTPVSALIHAATMVTAGVYLIARTHPIFELAPVVMTVVAIIGAATLIVAACSALVQRDIKRVLAYSTISQLGYMFLALGLGAFSAAMFHFMTHAFFKALLFLGAGSVIIAMHHEHDMFQMGGLWKRMPVTFWTFLIGAASLAALPLVTAGFYSKDLILFKAFSAERGGVGLWLAGLVGAFLTALYTFRMVFVTFFGERQREPETLPRWPIKTALVVLAFFSITAGFVELPRTLGHVTIFSGFLTPVLPEFSVHGSIKSELLLQLIAALVSVGGIAVAWAFWIRTPQRTRSLAETKSIRPVRGFFFHGWDFDALYNLLFARPYRALAEKNRHDFLDQLYTAVGDTAHIFHRELSRTETGRIRWYASGIAAGAVILLAMAIWL